MYKKIINKKNIVFIILILFIILKIFGLKYGGYDENIHFYQGYLISKGYMPYKDFTQGHPPLQQFLFALVFFVFGNKILLAKAFAAVFSVLSIVLLYRISKKLFSEDKAIIATALFSFSFIFLKLSSVNNGQNLALFLLLLGFYFIIQKKEILGGILFALACFAAYYSAFFVFGILFYYFSKQKLLFFKKNRIFFSFVIAAVLIFSSLFILSGDAFIDSTINQFLVKKEVEGNKGKTLSFIFLYDILLFGFFILFFIQNKIKKINVFSVTLSIYILFILLIKVIFDHYFFIIMPFVSILAAVGIIEIVKKFNIKIKKNIIIIFSLVIVIFSIFNVYSYVKFIDKFSYKDHELVAEFIDRTAAKDETIFGDVPIVPLLALLSERDIILRYADTYDSSFNAGMVESDEMVRNIRKDGNLKYVIVRIPGYLIYDPEMIKLIEGCSFADIFIENDYYLIFDCKNDVGMNGDWDLNCKDELLIENVKNNVPPKIKDKIEGC